MPLWLLFLGAFLVIAFACVTAVWYFLTAVLGTLVMGASYATAAGIAGSLVILLLLFIGALFFFLGRIIVVPLSRLSRAMRDFSKTESPVGIPQVTGAPSEMKELTEAFETMMGKVAEAHKRDAEVSSVKSDFISTAAHQLRTPLTGIRWSLEALQKSAPTEEQTVLIDGAVAKSKELVAIVGTLLDISAIESGKYNYQFKPMDVGALLREASSDFAPLAQKANVSLVYTGVEGTLPPVRADRERVKWIIENLIENALRYTPPGGSVRLTTDVVLQTVQVRVRDTGIGILPKDRNNIFERFFRGENAIHKQNEGNGLGLYIARTIAKDHGGELEFRANENGPGTTFMLSLPIMPS